MSITQFLEENGLVISKQYGDEIIAYCPWHDDSNASLNINPIKGVYNCFNGCIKGRGGLKGLLEALQPNSDIYYQYMVKFVELDKHDVPYNYSPKKDPSYDINELPLAVDNDYLQSRNITNETVGKFFIKFHKLLNAIIIPIYVDGVLVGSVQRNISMNPKYINSPGLEKGNFLFPIDMYRPANDKIILVEGIFDAINAHQAGLTNVVSSLGGNLTNQQVRLLGRLTKIVVICPDKDSSGLKMAERSTEMLIKKGLHVEYVIPPEPAKDFGEVENFNDLKFYDYFYLSALKKELKDLVGV